MIATKTGGKSGRPAAILAALLFLALATPFAPAARGVDTGGFSLPERLSIGDRESRLAGSGLRTKIFFKIYAAGLYLDNPVTGLDQAVNSDRVKAVLMRFIYDGVSGDKLREAWREGFAANTPDPSPDLRDRMDRFVELFTATAKKDDRVLLAYRPGLGTTVSFNGREAATIPGADFNRALLSIWFGPKPADADLKEKIARDLRNWRP